MSEVGIQKSESSGSTTPRCAHGIKLPEPCIECEIERTRSQLEHHLTCASLAGRRLAELGRRKRSEP